MAISTPNQIAAYMKRLGDKQLEMIAYDSNNPNRWAAAVEKHVRDQERMNSEALKQNGQKKIIDNLFADNKPDGIAYMEPQFAAKGGITRASSLNMGYSKDLPEEAQKILKMRYDQMKDLEEPDYIPPQYAAEGDLLESQVPSDRQKDIPLTSREIADMLLHPVKMTESGGRQSAISPKGARGVMQIMPNTGPEAARLAGLKWDYNKYAKDEEYNTKLGHAYLTSMIDRFGDTEKALAAYNWGPGNLSKALEKASASGRDWKTFLPTETQNYIGKVLGQNQAYLPARQEPQGVEAESGVDIYDKGFMPEGVRIQGGDKYPYPTPDSSSKGLDALRYAYRLANTRQGQSPLGRKNGGPLYLQEGNDGTTVGSEDQSYIEKLNRELAAEQEQERRKIEEETSKPFVDPRISKYIKRAEEEKNKYAYSRPESFQESTSPFESVSPGQRLSQEYGKRFREAMSVPQTDIFTRMINPPEGGYRLFGNSDEEQSLISQTEDSTPPGWTTPPEKQSGSPRPDQTGIASVPPRPSILDQARGITQGAYPIDSYTGQDQGKAGIPSARPALAPPQIAPRDSSGKTIGTPPAGPIVTPPAGPTAEDTSFNSVMSQVQKAIGSKVPDELQDQMKDYQKNLAQMGNDKVVDALFAAAKTLGGQRMGQRNFADAIANAGLAAQEAQKRIYKAEDDMRKYRGDLLKAQDTNNREAATIAMNRIVQLDHDRKGLQIAMIQAQKANDTATMQMDRYEKIAQYKDVSERRRAIINRLGQIQRAKADITPSQYDVDPRETEKKLAPYNREEAGLQAELDELNRQSPGSKIIKPSNIQSKPTREDLKSKYGLD